MHTALLVDYGGVLTTSVLDSFAAFCRDENIEPDAFKQVFLRAAQEPQNPFTLVESGALSQDDFDREVGALLSDACGRPIAHENLKARLFAGARPDEAMRAVVGRARALGVKTALLSNSWGGDDYPLAELTPLFDDLVISGEVRLRKPDVAIYHLAAQRLDVKPVACVFVDDFRVNIEAAESVGMAGVLHRDVAATTARLSELLGVELG